MHRAPALRKECCLSGALETRAQRASESTQLGLGALRLNPLPTSTSCVRSSCYTLIPVSLLPWGVYKHVANLPLFYNNKIDPEVLEHYIKHSSML